MKENLARETSRKRCHFKSINRFLGGKDAMGALSMGRGAQSHESLGSAGKENTRGQTMVTGGGGAAARGRRRVVGKGRREKGSRREKGAPHSPL